MQKSLFSSSLSIMMVLRDSDLDSCHTVPKYFGTVVPVSKTIAVPMYRKKTKLAVTMTIVVDPNPDRHHFGGSGSVSSACRSVSGSESVFNQM